MIKFLVILSLTIYVISKIGGFFFRAGVSSHSRQQQNRTAPGPVNPNQAKGKRTGKIKGGDYVDYEEVK